ncbi:C69 family dipeptidase [Treponema sp. OMZ 840]
MNVFSCDTMVALGNSTESGRVIFAKNSDRPLTEAQPLAVYPAADYTDGETVKCTYIEIPQALHTYRVLGSKPYWIWGFEQGINECGVAVGNEAVWAREPESQENGLLGMDFVRLALERGSTAYEALHVITDLLEAYGQGGNAAVNMEHRYHNSFLIADYTEAWILDTCNRRWVARRVKDVAGISNCYSTEEYWEEESGDVKEWAYKNGWISPNVPFNFAKAYGSLNLKHRAAHPRFVRLNKLLNAAKGHITVDTVRTVQRDHFEGELIEPRWSPADGLHVSICMHAINETSGKTAAASYVELTSDRIPVWYHAFACPCLSIFAPYTVQNKLPETLSNADSHYSSDSAWWQFERLQYALEQDYHQYMALWRPLADKLEESLYAHIQQNGAPDDITIAENTKRLLAAVNEMYTHIVTHGKDFAECQHFDMNKTAKKRAKIIF